MAKKDQKDGIVYSTNSQHRYDVRPNEAAAISKDKQQLRVVLDRKNRGGKTVTLISGYIGKEEDLEKLARELKARCGVGGAVKDREIIIQGDHRERVLSLLLKAGYNAKISG
jgi:translation initiation factor 1